MGKVIGIIAALTAQTHRREFVKWEIGILLLWGDYIQEARHHLISRVGLKSHLLPNPFRTFFRNGFLSQFIAKADFKLRPIEAFLPVEPGNIKFPSGLLGLICRKSRRGENEPQFFNAGQTFFQFLIGIDGEAGCRNPQLTFLCHSFFQVVFQAEGYIVNHLGHPLHLRNARLLLGFLVLFHLYPSLS